MRPLAAAARARLDAARRAARPPITGRRGAPPPLSTAGRLQDLAALTDRTLARLRTLDPCTPQHRNAAASLVDLHRAERLLLAGKRQDHDAAASHGRSPPAPL